MPNAILLSVLAIITVVYSQPSNWNRLAITYPAFNVIPMDSSLTDNQGFELASTGGCTDNGFYGYRYTWPKHGNTVAFIYSESGLVVGLQWLVPTAMATHPLAWTEDELIPGYSRAGVYFTDPETVCDKETPTWDRVTAQYGDSFLDFPLLEKDVSFPWTLGRCFKPLMGVHYWNNITTVNVKGDDYIPFFLMFNHGQLNAFGFSLIGDVKIECDLLEHPAVEKNPIFFIKGNYPDYFDTNVPYRNTCHVYLQDFGCKDVNYQC